jgi:phosphatidylglycerophosphate synthase
MTDKTDNSRRFWTIPNMLTILRFAMIPVIVWLYVVKKAYYPPPLWWGSPA